MAAHPRIRLDSLPAEILRLISTFTPAESVLLTLCSLNHAVRQVCYDPFIFRSCIEYNQSQNTVDYEDDRDKDQKPKWQDLDIEALSKILGGNVQAWVRLAVADSLGARLLAEYFDDQRGSMGKDDVDSVKHPMAKFVPQLLVLGHPQTHLQAVDALEAIISTPVINREARSTKRLTRRCFQESCLEAMDRLCDTSSSIFWVCASVLSDPTDSRDDVARRMNYHFISRCENVIASKADLTSTMGTLMAWSWLLKDYLDQWPVGDNHRHEQPCETPEARFTPRLENFPWYRKLSKSERIPLPFMRKDDWQIKVDSRYRLVSWDEWVKWQVEEMARSSNLQSSSWCGYWSYESQRHAGMASVEFAEAVENLNLHVMEYIDDPVQDTRRLLGAHRPDINFHLEGYITPHGQFKLGPPGEFWAWFGHVTPFGLFGFWGSSDGSQSAGACWLWQKAWTQDANKARLGISDSETASEGEDAS